MTTFVLSFYSILLLWVLPTHLIAFHRSNHTSPSWRSNSVLVLDFLVFYCMAQGTKWIGKGLFAIPLIVRVWCKCYFALKNFLTFHTFPSHSLLYTALYCTSSLQIFLSPESGFLSISGLESLVSVEPAPQLSALGLHYNYVSSL